MRLSLAQVLLILGAVKRGFVKSTDEMMRCFGKGAGRDDVLA